MTIPPAQALAPIALFAYNRPEHLKRTVDALAACPLAESSRLLVFSDAPSRPEHERGVEEVRRYLSTAGGFASVGIVEREHNLGLARSIEDGVGQLCAEHGRVVVLEDDIVVAPAFLSFLNLALEQYVDEPRVMQVSGYMFPGDHSDRGDAVFLPLISCWGWATWQRAWTAYDPSAAGVEALRRDPELRRRFNLDGAYDYYGMLENQLAGGLDSWGVRWLLSVFLANGVVLYPTASLVENIGADGTGTHGRGSTRLHGVASGRLDVGVGPRFPPAVEIDPVVLGRVQSLLRAERPGVVGRVIQRLWQYAR
jgi:hypothetical protein